MSKIFKSYQVLFDLNIAHNDIKPENVVMNTKCDAKLIDFGFAKAITSDCVDLRCTAA